MSSNPFYGLFNNSEEKPSSVTDETKVKEQIIIRADEDSEPKKVPPDEETAFINALAEDIFHLTINNSKHRPKNGKVGQLVYLEDIASAVAPQLWMSLETLKMGIFERLLLEDPARHTVTTGGRPQVSSIHLLQKDCLLYLYECYRRLKMVSDHPPLVGQIISFVVCDAATALRQPCLFESQNVHRQVVQLFEMEEVTEVSDFIDAIVEVISKDEGDESVLVLIDAFRPVLACVQQDFAQSTIIRFPRQRFILLQTFVVNEQLSEVLVDFLMPSFSAVSLSYVDTLLGAILNLSCLPKTVDGMVEYFEKPLDGALSSLEASLWAGMGEIVEKASQLVEALLRRPSARPKLLAWIGGCLDASVPRGRMWPLGSSSGYPSDGFALNLASMLLHLAKPLKHAPRYLKIDPTYSACIVDSVEEMNQKGVHCKSLRGESCLQPTSEGGPRRVAISAHSFTTEIFYLTHRALDLSVRVVFERAQGLYQEIGRLQHTLSESSPRPELVEAIRQRMEMDMSRYLCMRCALLEPNFLKLMGDFSVATSEWLVQVLLTPDTNEPKNSYAPLTYKPLSFPLPEIAPSTFRCIPELVVETVVRFLRLVSNYSPASLESGGTSLLNPLLTMLLVLMGSNRRARNPHLRAQLAQALECLLPRDTEQPSLNPNPLGVFYRQVLFNDHPHRRQIVECLLQVFVSIEMTGQSVAFEQKFNYRRPMYTVMDYLWGLPCHREVFKRLAEEAERGMEETTPPLFLRFINLLMNDAVFLLDEALANMAQLRTMQTARDAGEWEQLPVDERERNEQFFRQVGMTARFDNILGKETIHTLEYMSSEIKTIFCHSTMVDRIAAMLNYFLYHLVGPKMKNFKVKDKTEYKFEPGGIVLDICRIYGHLGGSTEFCSAVSRDGRSYSPQLFLLAQDVLAKIGGIDLVAEMAEIGARVERLASQQQTEEELLSEAPEEFLDPIMSTLMSDPVILPSSKITIDRSTIARHLLSDQTDPFNRSPLTMNMVKSNVELKKAIEEWVAERKASAPIPSTSDR